MQIRIRQWDPTTLKDGRIVLLVGRRGGGKSTLMTSIMHALRDRLEFAVAMTPTEDSMDMFRKHMPESWIHSGFAGTQLEDMMKAQRRCSRERRATKHLGVFMDDCMYDKKVLKTVSMRDLFMNGRHLRITFCCAVQYLMDMGPDLRTQCDYVICTKEMILSNKMKLWKYFFGMFEKFEDFSNVMDKCTQNYSALVADFTTPTSSMDSCLFWYRAEQTVPPFRIGSDSFWRLSERCTKSRQEFEEEAARKEDEEQEIVHRRAIKKQPTIVRCEDRYGNTVLPGGGEGGDERARRIEL